MVQKQIIKLLQIHAPHSLDATHLAQAINLISHNETDPLTCLSSPHPGADPESGLYRALWRDYWSWRNPLQSHEAYLDIIRPHQLLPTSVLFFICRCLKPDNDDILPRGDYKEFLELAKSLLVVKLSRRRESPKQSNVLALTVMFGV